MRKRKILIIDDENALLESLEMYLTEKDYDVACALNATEGLRMNSILDPDVIILDIRLPDIDGLEVLQKIRQDDTRKGIIIITAFHDMENTIKAIKFGATEYITKPIDVEELEGAIHRVTKIEQAIKDTDMFLSDGAFPSYEKGKIIGKSRGMKEIFKTIGTLSENRVTVLVEGETGTGKELIAQAIHYHSSYQDNPFLAINCSAIVPTLLESELFGHEKGAFTGASHTKKGKFELAGSGTIFLDEVSEIPYEIQAKLLRFLQEKEFERVGGERSLKSNARIIAATNRNLWQMVKDGGFREDLYYRLSVATIKVPPLRERKTDIPMIVRYLIGKINTELRKSIKKVEERAIDLLMEYHWPGNVRELENILTRAAIKTVGNVILEESIAPLLFKTEKNIPEPDEAANTLPTPSLAEIERKHILNVLQYTHWHMGKTCEILGISRPTLRQKLKGYDISVEENS